MRLLTSFFTILVIFVSLSFSQTDDDGRELLKKDFKDVNVVAHIQIEKVEISEEFGKPSTTGGYTSYKFTGKIIEAFKGKIKKGETIVYYSVIEGQPPNEWLMRPRIRFLETYKTKTGQKNFGELENSAREANETNLSMLRKIRKTA